MKIQIKFTDKTGSFSSLIENDNIFKLLYSAFAKICNLASYFDSEEAQKLAFITSFEIIDEMKPDNKSYKELSEECKKIREEEKKCVTDR